MYKFEYRYELEQESKELWAWCRTHLKGSFNFIPKGTTSNILNAEYKPMTMIEDYGWGDPNPDKRFIVYVEIKDKKDAATFKVAWK